jgi:rhomboid family protein
MFFPIGDDLQKRYFPAVGAVIIGLNFVVFLYQHRLWNEALETLPRAPQSDAAILDWYLSTDYARFMDTWGVVPKNIARGHVMCVFTYMFLHGGFVHFLGNMMVLWVLVGSLENTLGQTRFMICYLIWGVAGGIAYAAMSWGQEVPMVGASGAIAGMIGAYFIAFGALTRIRVLVWILIPFRWNIPAGAFVFIWFLSQLAGIEEESKYGNTGVAWYAHLGGFAAGFITMYIFKREVHARLGRDRTGKLQILADEELEKADEVEAIAVEQEEAEAGVASKQKKADFVIGPPETCPDCGTAVSEANKIVEKMLRCPNPKCQKLIYYS